MNTYGLEPQQMPVISIDFDGCIVEDKWPDIGDPIPGAIETINEWYDAGYWIIINSCRDSGKEWRDMFDWLRSEISFHEINDNLDWRIDKYGTNPRKIGADIYIDDHNIEQCRFKVDGSIWGRYAWIVERYMRGTPDA